LAHVTEGKKTTVKARKIHTQRRLHRIAVPAEKGGLQQGNEKEGQKEKRRDKVLRPWSTAFRSSGKMKMNEAKKALHTYEEGETKGLRCNLPSSERVLDSGRGGFSITRQEG